MEYKILIIITRAFNPNKGGVQRSTYKMSSYFKSQGHQTHVFSYKKEGNIPQDVAKLHTVKVSEKNRSSKSHDRLKEVIDNIEPDIVINQMPYEREIGAILRSIKAKHNFLLLGCLRNTLFAVKLNLNTYLSSVIPRPLHPFVDNVLGRWLLLKKHKSSHSSDLKFILDTYDYFVMFGPPNMQELKYFVGNYKLDKTHLIPNSILSVLDEIPPKEKRILFLSRVAYKQKRADLILPFWKKIMHKLPDWQFDIVGDGGAFEDLKNQIKEENIPRVNMYGRQTPYEYYKRAPIYIMTSEFEGFPNTLIEAQSFASVPVVYDSYPVCSWVIKDAESGFLIPPFKVDEMADKVFELTQNKKLRTEMMQASLENARQFELKNVGQKWIEFFNRELGNK